MTATITDLLDASEVHGGKARGLRTLLEGGFAVPSGLALSVDDVLALLGGDDDLRSTLEIWLQDAGGAVAVRSSALDEDGATSSFAGMFESRLNVRSALDPALRALDVVSSSGSSARVESYAGSRQARIPVVVQRMVVSRISGVAFTEATAVDGAEVLYIEWIDGLGDQLVSGHATPSRLVVPWEAQQLKRTAVTSQGATIGPDDLARLCDAFDRLQDTNPGAWDVEWSIDTDGMLWLLQLRPITRPVLVPGESASTIVAASVGTGEGPAFLVGDDGETAKLRDGDVLVAEVTEVDYVPAMRRAVAIVTEQGGMLSHAAIVARELGKPCVVGATGVRALFKAGVQTTVDGSAGTVQQGRVLLGAARGQEIDWRSLCFYDRGFEHIVSDLTLYIEALPTGIVAYTSEDIDPPGLAVLQRELRRSFHQDVSVVIDQKLLWFWEWRRFDQLGTVTFMAGLVKTAVARWDSEELQRVTGVIKRVAALSTEQPFESKVHELFLRELGAALHALCGVAVEGIGAWASFRDSLLWRQAERVSFNELLAHDPADARLPTGIRRILACVAILSDLRNEAYPYFVRTGAFKLEYFEHRDELVAAVCKEQGVAYEDETKSLNQIYGLPSFRLYDAPWQVRALAVSTEMSGEL